MDQVTQQNAALVEQSAAAAASLKDQAVKLADVVSVFKLSGAQTRQVIAQSQATARAAKPAKPVSAANAVANAEPRQAPKADGKNDDWKEF